MRLTLIALAALPRRGAGTGRRQAHRPPRLVRQSRPRAARRRQGGAAISRDAGLDVELIAPADPSAPPRLVAAGQADIAITYQPDLMLQVNEGLPLIRFGTLVETPLNCLIVLEDGPIKTLADLKGKTVGYLGRRLRGRLSRRDAGDRAGSRSTTSTLVNVNFNLSPSLISGQVDAAIGGFRNFELTSSTSREAPGSGFYPEEHGVPVYDELIYVTRSDMTARRSAPRPLPRGGRGGDDLPHQPPRRGAGDVHQGASRSRRRPQPPRLRPTRCRASPSARPRSTPAATTRFAEFMKERGLIAETVPVEDYAVALD